MKLLATVLFSARAEHNLHLQLMKVRRRITRKWSSKCKSLLTIIFWWILLVGLFPCGIVRADPGWTTTEVVSLGSWLDSYEPSLDVDLDGMVHIAWADSAAMIVPEFDYEKADIYYRNKSRRVDWSPVAVYYSMVSTESTTEYDPFGYGSGRPSLSVSPYNPWGYGYSVYITWEDWSRLPDSADSAESLYNPYQDVFLKIIWRTGLGDYWTTTMLVTESNDFNYGEPSLDVGPDGVAHIAWTDGGIYYRNLTVGAGFSEVESVATTPAGNPSLGVGPDGTVHIAWQDMTDFPPDDPDIFYRRYEPGNGWTTTEEVSTESTGYSSKPSLTVSHDGKVHIVWCDSLDGDTNIFYRRYEPGNGWTTTEEVSTGIEPSLDVGSDGKVHIAWADLTDYGGSGDDLDIFYRRYEPGNGWTTTEVVSTDSTDRSTSPSLAVGPDGTVHIAWEDKTNLDNSVSFPDDFDIFYKSYEPPGAWWHWLIIVCCVLICLCTAGLWYYAKKRRPRPPR